jgi:Ca2+-binding RTX toxin-like protein
VTVTVDGVPNDGGSGGAEGDDVTPDVEVVRGGMAGDTLTGGAQGATLFGEDGADVLTGGAGNDALRGGGGTDTLQGAGGSDYLGGGDDDDGLWGGPGGSGDGDILDGGSGADTALYADRTQGVNVTLDQSSDDGYAGENDDVVTENVVGGSGADAMTGSPASDGLFGGPGGDTLDGKGGSDALYGQENDDTLTSADGIAGGVVDSSPPPADQLTRDALDNPVGCEQVTQSLSKIRPVRRP